MAHKSEKLSYKIFQSFMEADICPMLKEYGMAIKGKYEATVADGDCTYHFGALFTSYPREDVGGLRIGVRVTFASLKPVLLNDPDFNPKSDAGYGGVLEGILPRPLQNPWAYIKADSDPAELGALLAEQIKTRVFPFYDYFGNISNVIAAAKSGKPFPWNRKYLAATLWLRGDQDGARSTLFELQVDGYSQYLEERKYHYWKSLESLAIFSKALNISLPELQS